VFDDDIMLTDSGDAAFVRTETVVGYSYEPYDIVKGRHASIASDSGRLVSSLPLLRRTVRFQGNETVIGSAPVIRSRGCDAAKLKADRFTVGLSVNGIYRVIDVTGDRGSFAIRDRYTTSDIVTCISKVFGDLVVCEVAGSEFWIRLRDGFGANGTLSLFWSGDTDCASEIGLCNAIADAFETHATTTRRSTAVSLRERGEVTWYGGAAPDASPTPTALLSALRVPDAFTDTQSSSLLTGEDYWTQLQQSDAVTKATEKLQAACGKSSTITDTVSETVAGYESELVFADVTDTGYFDAELLFSGLGTALAGIVNSKPWIWSIDPYQSRESVLAEIQKLLSSIASADGVVAASTGLDWMSVTHPLPTNYAVAAQLRIRHDAAKYFPDASEADPETQAINFCRYAVAVTGTVQSGTQATKSNTSDQSGAVVIAGFNTTAAVQIQAAQVDILHLVWETLSEDVQDAIIKAATAKAQEYLDAGVSVIEDIAGDVAGEIADGLRSAADFVSDLLGGFSLTAAQRQVIAALLKANEALRTAEGFVHRMQARYRNLMQQIESISNFAINFSGSLGFKTKFVTCTATGSVSALQVELLAQFLGLMNELASKLNELLKKLHDLLERALDAVAEIGQVFAVDVHREALHTLAGVLDKKGIQNVEMIWADVEKGIPIDAYSLDAVVVSNVLFQLHDIDAMLSYIAKILKPEGQMLVVEWSHSHKGIGPHQDHVVTENKAETLVQKHGFRILKRLPAGDYHYAFIALSM
jgi:SAM-dependent methyltransferase